MKQDDVNRREKVLRALADGLADLGGTEAAKERPGTYKLAVRVVMEVFGLSVPDSSVSQDEATRAFGSLADVPDETGRGQLHNHELIAWLTRLANPEGKPKNSADEAREDSTGERSDS